AAVAPLGVARAAGGWATDAASGFATCTYGTAGLRWYRIAEGWSGDAPSPPAPLPGGEGCAASSVDQPASNRAWFCPGQEAAPGIVPPPLPLGEGRGAGSLPPLQLLGQVQDALLLC